MPDITAAEVKRLRDATGAGMMDAKRALEAAGIEFIPADELKGPGVRLKRSGGDEPKEKKRGRK